MLYHTRRRSASRTASASQATMIMNPLPKVSCQPCTVGTDGCPTNGTRRRPSTSASGGTEPRLRVWICADAQMAQTKTLVASEASAMRGRVPWAASLTLSQSLGFLAVSPFLHVLCGRWLTGPYCRICNVTDGSRYYDSSQSACVPCEAGKVATPLAILGVVVVVVWLLLVWWAGGSLTTAYSPLRNRLRKMARVALGDACTAEAMLAFYQASPAPKSEPRTWFTLFLCSLRADCDTCADRVSGPDARISRALLDTFDGLNLNIDAVGLLLAFNSAPFSIDCSLPRSRGCACAADRSMVHNSRD